MIRFDAALRQRLHVNLSAHAPRAASLDGFRHSAVAITVVDVGDGRAGFWLCRRASRMSNHAGQLALPGGRLDPGESVIDAALRELDEELGVRLDASEVLGVLDDYPTRSGFVITPVVVWGGAAGRPRPNRGEVDELFTVPLDELCAPGSPVFLSIPESERPVVQLPISMTTVHAPTAALLVQFRCVGLEGHAGMRVDHFDAPVWAWR